MVALGFDGGVILCMCGAGVWCSIRNVFLDFMLLLKSFMVTVVSMFYCGLLLCFYFSQQMLLSLLLSLVMMVIGTSGSNVGSGKVSISFLAYCCFCLYSQQ